MIGSPLHLAARVRSPEQKAKRAAATRAYRKTPEAKVRRNAAARKDRAENPDRARLKDRTDHYRKKYGLSLADIATMREQQEDKCAICRSSFGTRKHKFHVDHDHETGAVRGLLCFRCNTGLGYVEDLAFAAKAGEYLARV